MAMKLIIIYPGLRYKMAYNGEDAESIADILDISASSARRRLNGSVDFELPEIKKLTDHYKCSFDDLFEVVDA